MSEEQLLTEWRSAISRQIEDLSLQVRQMNNTVMTRSDVSQMLGERVEKSAYVAAQSALVERIERLEASPQRLLGWLAVGISGCGALMTLFTIVTAAVLFLIAHH